MGIKADVLTGHPEADVIRLVHDRLGTNSWPNNAVARERSLTG